METISRPGANPGVPARPTLLHGALCLLLFLGNLSAQLYLQRGALDDGVENRSSPSSTDTRDYLRRAEIWADGSGSGGFTAAFEDGYRTPAYPLYLAAFLSFSTTPLRAARTTQVLLTAGIVLLAFLTLVNLRESPAKALGGAALVAAWPPLYHFSPILIAEACSLFGLALLLYALSRPPSPRLHFLVLPLLLAALTYLKPNHALFLVPVALFLWMRATRGAAAACALAFLLLIAPWMAFVRAQGGPFGMSTASGINLYLGSVAPPEGSDAGTLPARYGAWTGMPRAEARVLDRSTEEKAGAESAHLGGLARSAWREAPLRTAGYGFAKVLHGFGFSLRGIRDIALVALFAASLWASARLWKEGSRRAWVLLFWGFLLAAAAQMFLYLPNQRFKTVAFDLPALLMLALALRMAGRDLK